MHLETKMPNRQQIIDITFNQIKEHIYNDNLFDVSEWCANCAHGECVKDSFSTGDSPTVYECNSDWSECPAAEDIADRDEWNDWYQDAFDEAGLKRCA